MESGTETAAATPAPSAGAAAPAAPAQSTPSSSYAGMTADQILDAEFAKGQQAQTAEEEAEKAAKAEKKAAREAAKAAEAEEGEEPLTAEGEESPEPEVSEPEADEKDEKQEAKGDDELEEILKDAELPDNWKDTIKAMKGVSPKVAKQIRDEHFELTEYRRQMPIEQVRTLRTMFTSAEEAEEARAAKADIDTLNMSLYNEPEKFLGYVRDVNPDAFPGLLQTYPRWLFENDKPAFVESLAKPINQHFVDSIERYAKRNGREIGVEAVAVIRELAEEMVKGAAGGEREAENPWRERALQLEAEKQHEEQQRVKQEAVSFVTGVRESASSQVKGEITKALSKLPLSGIPEGGREEIHKQALYHVVQRVMSDSVFVRWVQDQARQSRTPENQKRVINAVLARAKPHITQAVAGSLRWYRGVAGGVSARENRDTSDSPKEIGQGAPAGSGKRTGRNWHQLSDADKRKLSADEIIRLTEAGQLTS